jgi:hypothetical protein
LTLAARQGYCLVRAAVRSFVCEAGRFFLAGERPASFFVPCRQQAIDAAAVCQHCVYMDFRTATDILGLPATELAKAFGLQPQTIRQMRLSPAAASYRSPPNGWEAVIVRLAIQRGRELEELVRALAGQREQVDNQ